MLKKIIVIGAVLVAVAALAAGAYAMSNDSSSTATQIQRRDQVSRSSAAPAQQSASAAGQQAVGNDIAADAYAQAAARGGQSNGNRGGRGRGGQGSYGAGMNVYTPLSEAEIEGLQRAILEEYGALSLYQSVLADFGEAAPFTAVAASEQRHLDTLLKMAGKYGVEVPELVPASDLPEFPDLFAACEAARTAEIVDGALYDELMGFTSHADLIRVYTNLQKASLENHLPAFDACQ